MPRPKATHDSPLRTLLNDLGVKRSGSAPVPIKLSKVIIAVSLPSDITDWMNKFQVEQNVNRSAAYTVLLRAGIAAVDKQQQDRK